MTTDAAMVERLRANAAMVRERMAVAATRSGRRPETVRLVGVTKYVEPGIARLVLEAGVVDLGESRPQELWRKAEHLSDCAVEWHMIGHLQRNKVKRTLPLVSWIHSGDSLELLREIDKQAGAIGKTANLLLEVNVSGDAAKTGLTPDAVVPLFPQIALLRNVRVRGLMSMAGLEGGVERARYDFAALRELSQRLRSECPNNIQLDELSMGMSGDFEAAIEEGATMVRVGSALFEGIVADD